jgi:16S rRNA G966 N2-methylase RsmD
MSKVLFIRSNRNYVGSTQSSTSFEMLHRETIDYMFVDPPFGGNLNLF